MNRRFLHPAALFLLLTLGVALCSWVGSVYGWAETRSLLNAEGMRWLLRNAVPNLLTVPWLGHLVILSFGVGVCVHSGWGTSMRKILLRRQGMSKKQWQAWKASLMAGLLWLVLCTFMAFDPWGNLLSITGQWVGSPLADGWSVLCAIGFGLVGLVYGYATDYYRSGSDVLAGVSYLSVCFPSWLVTLFCLSLFFCSFSYTGLYHCLGLSDAVMGWIYRALVALSLLFVALGEKR